MSPHSTSKLHPDEYYYRVKALRSRTHDNQKSIGKMEVNDQKFDLTKYQGMKDKK